MAVTYRAPSGTTYQFPEGTSYETALRYMADQEKKRAAGRAAASKVAASQPEKRNVLERFGDVFSATFNEMPLVAMERGAAIGTAPSAKLSPMGILNQAADTADAIGAMVGAARGVEQTEAPKARTTKAGALATAALSLAPGNALSAVDARGRLRGGLAEARTPGARDALRAAEESRRATFAQVSAEDPFWEADGGAGGKALHGAAALLGVLGAAATDPTSYVSAGRTVLQRALFQGGIAGVTDVLGQQADFGSGIVEDYDFKRTLLSAAAGATFSSMSDLATMGPKKWVTNLYRTSEDTIAPLLREADELAGVPLTAKELPDLRWQDDGQLDLFDIPGAPKVAPFEEPSGGQLVPADKPAADTGQQDLFGDALPATAAGGPDADASGGPKADPWKDFFTTGRGTRERREAAALHLDNLRKAIKPEHAQEFLDAVARGIDPMLPNGEKRVSYLNPRWVDWSKLDRAPDELVALIRTVEDIFGDAYKAAGNTGPRSFEETARRAQLFGTSVSDMTKTHADVTGEGGLSARMLALEDAALASDAQLAELLEAVEVKMAKGTFADIDRLELAGAIERTALLDSMAKATKSEIARSLAVMRRLSSPNPAVNDLKDALAEALNKGGGVKDEDLASVVKDLKKAYKTGGSMGLRNRVRVMRQWGVTDYVGYVVNAALLSAPKTFIRNVVGPAFHALQLMGDRYAAAGLGAARGTADAVTLREANAYVAAYFTNFLEASVIGAKAFVRGVPIETGRSNYMPDQGAFVPFEATPQRLAQMRKNALSLSTARDALLIPLFATSRALAYRPMLAADEFYRHLGRRAELSALAHREAAFRSRQAPKGQQAKVYSEVLTSIVDEPTAEAVKAAKLMFARAGAPDKDGVFNPGTQVEEYARVLRSLDIQAAAVDHAHLLTFQRDGDISRAADKLLRLMPLVKFGFVNFVRTPLAIFRSAVVDRNPALFLLARENREALAPLFKQAEANAAALERGGAEADLVLSRMVTGTATMFMAWMLYANGDLMGPRTASGSKQEKDDGVLPFSLRLPTGEWVQLTTLSPIAEPLRIVAAVAEAMRYRDMTDEQGDTLMALLATSLTMAPAGLIGLSDSTLSATMVQGISDLLDVTGQGGVSTMGAPEDRSEQSEKALQRAVTARLTPFSSLTRSIAQEIDPQRRDPEGWVEAFTANIPFLSKTLPARRDFMGRLEVIPEGQRGAFEAFPRSKKTADPLGLELSRLAVALGGAEKFALEKPNRKFNDKDIDFREYNRLLEVQGQLVIHPATRANMEDTLRAQVTDPGYAAMTDPQKAAILKKTVSVFREIGTKAVKDPSSPYYMEEMVRRTARERLLEVNRATPLSPAMAARRARGYGLDLSTSDPTDSDLQALRGVLTD